MILNQTNSFRPSNNIENDLKGFLLPAFGTKFTVSRIKSQQFFEEGKSKTALSEKISENSSASIPISKLKIKS